MAPKKTRIIKSEWPSFIKNFNRQNQFRTAILFLGDKAIVDEPGMVLLGLAYEQKTNLIGIYCGGQDKDSPSNLVHTINGPRAIYLERDYDAPNPVTGLSIQGAAGTPTAYLMFLDVMAEETKRRWTSDIAYCIYEGRGMGHGYDEQDWHEEEAIIEKISKSFWEG